MLSIPVLTTKVTLQQVKEAVENIRQRDVTEWIREHCGESIFSVRRRSFGLLSEGSKGVLNHVSGIKQA